MEDKLFTLFLAIVLIAVWLAFCGVGYAFYNISFYRDIEANGYEFEYDSREYKGCRISEEIIDDEISIIFSCQIVE